MASRYPNSRVGQASAAWLCPRLHARLHVPAACRDPGAGGLRHDGLRAGSRPSLSGARRTQSGGRRGRHRRRHPIDRHRRIARSRRYGGHANPGVEQVQFRLADPRAGHRQPDQHHLRARLLRHRGRRPRHRSERRVSADGTTARHVQISVTADAPLLFWSLLSAGVSRKTPIAVQALAGVSAPLCTACGIEPFAIAAKDAGDPVNFGLADPTDPTLPTNYTFYYNCPGPRPPSCRTRDNTRRTPSSIATTPRAPRSPTRPTSYSASARRG